MVNISDSGIEMAVQKSSLSLFRTKSDKILENCKYCISRSLKTKTNYKYENSWVRQRIQVIVKSLRLHPNNHSFHEETYLFHPYVQQIISSFHFKPLPGG